MCKEKRNWIIGLLVSFIVCAAFAAFLSFRTMPLAEGWYTEYAWQINHGNLPYRDFEYLFFPLYIYLIAGITRIFGYNIIVMRVFGILLFGGIGASFYWLFSQMFHKVASVIAAIAAALFLQSEVVQIFYDYIRVHDLFLIITAVFLVKTTQECIAKEDIKSSRTVQILTGLAMAALVCMGVTGIVLQIKKMAIKRILFFSFVAVGGAITYLLLRLGQRNNRIRYSSNAILLGVFVSMECMVKQSTGILMIAFCVAYLIFCGIFLRNKRYYSALVGTIVGMLLSFATLSVFLLLTDSFGKFILSCITMAADAKGGLKTELFRWIPDSWSNFWNVRYSAFFIVLAVEIMLIKIKTTKVDQANKSNNSALSIVLFGIISIIICYVFSFFKKFSSLGNSKYIDLSALSFYLCTCCFFVMAFYFMFCFLTNKDKTFEYNEMMLYFPVLGVVFAQGYGVGMSGGLAASQTALGFGIIVAFVVHLAIQSKEVPMIAGVALISMFLCATFVGHKTYETYSWWGLTAGSLWNNTEEADVPLLENIKMRPEDKKCYETVYMDVTQHTEPDEAIFTFPQCPIFYTITDRHSLTYTKVQWFDVSSAINIEHDIYTLKENNPKVIVYVDVPEFVYQGHESAFSTYQTRRMKEFLMELVEKEYTEFHSIDIGNGYSVRTYVRNQPRIGIENTFIN